MPVQNILNKLTDISATPEVPVGTIFERYNPTTKSEEKWIYVFNDEAATAFAQGTVVMRKDGTPSGHDSVIATTSCAIARIQGVAQHAITAQYYGWILREGIGEVIADTGGLSANTGLVVGDTVAGTADNSASVVGATFGFATETVTATNKATCWIICRG